MKQRDEGRGMRDASAASRAATTSSEESAPPPSRVPHPASPISHPASPIPHSAVLMSSIDKSFGAVKANRGASLDVMQGEIHALAGENGAGKSTLMRILGGLMKPDAGKVEILGRDVTGWSTSEAIA